MTSDDIMPVLAKILEDDDSIRTACYGNITPGYPATLQDSKLTPTTPTAIWLRDIDKTESGFIGGTDYVYDILLQVDVMSLTSQYEAESLRRLCENLLKSTSTKSYGGSTWRLAIRLQSRPGARYDNDLSAWVAMLRMRAKGGYVA